MGTTASSSGLFREELHAQWASTLAALGEARAADDEWLAELLAGRLDDLRELSRRSGGDPTVVVLPDDSVAPVACPAA